MLQVPIFAPVTKMNHSILKLMYTQYMLTQESKKVRKEFCQLYCMRTFDEHELCQGFGLNMLSCRMSVTTRTRGAKQFLNFEMN